MHRQVVRVAPIVRRAGHAEGIGELRNAERTADAADVVGDQAHDVHRTMADVIGVVRDRVEKLADFDGHIQFLAQLDQPVDIGRGDRVFERYKAVFLERMPDLQCFKDVVALHGIE